MSRLPTAVLAVLAALTGAQELPVPLLGDIPRIPAAERPEARALVTLAEGALAAGLASTAVELHNRALALPDATPADREEAALGLALAHLERNRPADAARALALAADSPRRRLRAALAALLRNDVAAVEAASRDLDPAMFPSEERPWALLIRGIADAAAGRPEAAARLEEAAAAAVGASQRQRLELLGFRALVTFGRDDGAALAALEQRVREAGSDEARFALARVRAAALARRGDRESAASALLAAAGASPARRAEAELAAGLILGADSERGVALMRAAAAGSAPASLRARAIRGLAAAAAEVPAERVVRAANAAYAFLSDSNGGCPRTPEITDVIHLARAQLMLAAGSREQARAAAEDLLRETPASPLAPEAVRLLASVAWSEGAYRLAAGHLDRLAGMVAERDRDVVRLAAADCLFLAGDAAVAERAYAAVQAEARDPALRESAFYQAVLSALRVPGGLEPACARIEAAADAGKVGRERLLDAAWSAADTARRSGDAQLFARTLARLARVTEKAPILHDLRFEWLRALSALANGDRTTASRAADNLIERLGSLPKDAPASLRDSAPELRAHALLLRARSGPHERAAVEIQALARLRESLGKVSASAAAGLAEGRLLAAEGRHAEAQRRFEQLAETFATDPALSEYAALGLQEAADQALILAGAVGAPKLTEAARLLGLFLQRYPAHPALPKVALRQSEVYRRLGDFDSALRVLDDLARTRPEHPDRIRFELARGDCLLGLAALRRTPTGAPDRSRINRAVAAYERALATWAKDADTQAEARHKLARSLLERARGEAATDAEATRREARQLLAAEAAELLAGSRDRLGIEGRVWVARSLLLLGEHSEAEGDLAEAKAAYRLLRDLNAGLDDGSARLPGRAAAESKLAELEAAGSNPPAR